MSAEAHIVVVDDEAEVREMVAEYLGGHGFAVTTADGGPALREALAAGRADLVILDLRMPGEDGLSLARYVRENYSMGVIMLTAVSETVDRIIGLEVGADDYIAKPFDPRELLARVRSVLRRMPSEAPDRTTQAAEKPANVVAFGTCELNLEAQSLHAADGASVAITAMEFDLLRAFATHPNRVLTRDQLLDLAHNRDWEPFDRSIDVRITRIRRKIEPNPSKPQFIKTVRGSGYMFVPTGGGGTVD